jgi:hypothetical protein
MKGYVFVAAPGCKTEAQVARWAERGAEFVATVEAKPKKASKKKKR